MGLNRMKSTQGTFETFDGIKTYIATPTSDYSKDKAIFFISDVFGHGLNNNFVRTQICFLSFVFSYKALEYS